MSGLQEAFPHCPSSGLPNLAPAHPWPPALFLDDRHRVKLHPMLGDPDADYINANYIDVSHGLAPVISADLALPALGSLSREGRNLSADKWGFKWLGS